MLSIGKTTSLLYSRKKGENLDDSLTLNHIAAKLDLETNPKFVYCLHFFNPRHHAKFRKTCQL